MKKMKYYIILLSAVTSLMLYSCGEDYLYKQPKGVVVNESLNTPEGVDLLLISAYSILDGAGSVSSFYDGHSYSASIRNWVWDCASDDAYEGQMWADIQFAERYELLPTSGYLSKKWTVLYDAISRANDILKALNVAGEQISDADVKILAAQARFLRAFYHFRLQRMYYQIPYITEDIEQPELVPNDHPVWDEIEADLQMAIEDLPENWPGEPGRATKYAAEAVKAYVHLHQQEYAEAKPLLDDIINNGPFDLTPNFYDNYNIAGENNIESILEIQSSVNDDAGGMNGNADSWLINPYNRFTPSCCGLYAPSQDLVNAFKVDENGLPLLGINGPKFNDENLKNDMGILSKEEYIPTDELVDPRLDWTVGRRGVAYMDWGMHTGDEWIRAQAIGGPYNSKKGMFSQAEQPIASHTQFPRATAINFRAYRFAHVLLWRAECAVEDNELTLAKDLVNRVRRRASDDFVMGKCSTYKFDSDTITPVIDWEQPAANYHLGEYPSFPSQEYARAAVRMELRLETAMEGNRFFDLVRWGIDNEVLPKFIENDSKFRTIMRGATYNSEKNDNWPLPQSQLDIQPVLKQDPAY